MQRRTKVKSIDLRPWIVGMILFVLALGVLVLMPAKANAFERTITLTQSAFERYKRQQDRALSDCKNRGSDFIPLGEPVTVEITVAGAAAPATPETKLLTIWRCSESGEAKRRKEEARDSEAREFRIARDPNSECDRANLYEEHNGQGCRRAEEVIRSTGERDEAVTAFSELGAAVVQATTATQAAGIDSQQDALKLQEQTIIAGIAGAGIDTANAVFGAVQLSRAEADANRAAAGIKEGQAVYVDAENAAVAGKRNYSKRLVSGGSLADIETNIKADYDKRIKELQIRMSEQNSLAAQLDGAGDAGGASAASSSSAQIRAEIERLEADKANEIAKAHKAFANGISGSGIEETVRNNFGTFDNFRRNASKGVSESKAVAEQAAGASTNAKFRAISGGLALATQIGQLRAIRRLQQNLGDVEELPENPAPVVALNPNPITPTIPAIPDGPAADTNFEDFDIGDLGNGGPRGRTDGQLLKGKEYEKSKSKPRRTQVSGGGGGGGVGGGGGGSGASRAPASNRVSPNSIDYAGGGGGFGGGGGAVAGAQGDTDFQDALRSLLGGEKESDQNVTDFDYYRKVASSRGQRDDDEEGGDPRSIFERVKTKYNDVVNRGVI